MYINKNKQKFTGFVMRTLVQPGTRNEQDAYVLETDKRDLKLGLKENKAFESEVFEGYINEEVEVEGYMGQGIFLVTEIKRLNE
jgi:hypothetical protein